MTYVLTYLLIVGEQMTTKFTITKDLLFSELTIQDWEAILIHFNSIYTINELGKREKDVVYLAWLIMEGLLTLNLFDLPEVNQDVEFEVNDYDLAIGTEHTGFNLSYTINYYSIPDLIQILISLGLEKRINY